MRFRLFKYLGQYWVPAILTMVLVLGEVFLEILMPYTMADLIDQGINAMSMQVIWKYCIELALFAIGSLLCGVAAGFTCAKASEGFAKNLRNAMYDHLQDFSFKNIDKFSTASIVSRMTIDVQDVMQAFMQIIRTAIRSPLMLIFAFIMSFRIAPSVAMIFIYVVIGLAILLAIIAIAAHPFFENGIKEYDELNKVIQENLNGVRVVKSFNRQDYENNKFHKVSQNLYKFIANGEATVAFNNPVMMLAVSTALIGISWMGAHLIVSGAMTEGELTSLISYSFQILMSLMMLSMVLVQTVVGKPSADRICELLDEVPDLKNNDHPIMDVKDGRVDYDDVCFKYFATSEKNVLDHINLHIPSGSTVGIIGATGSAKSSLVSLIARLYDVNSGSVKVGGVDVRDYDLETLRNKVAVVLQKNTLFAGTIADNLRWGKPDATIEEIKHVCDLAQASSFVEALPDSYNTMITQGGTNVSGGQKQRLTIARALLKDPKILILDDSTSAVDTKTDAALREAFKSHIPGVTKFIVAQRINSIQDSDIIIILNDGHIEAQGTHDELLQTSSTYKEIWEEQSKKGGLE